MASALLASRNEPYWGERSVYMRKTPNPNPKLCPNPNPSFNQIPNGHEPATMESDDPAAPPAAATVVSDDSSSFNRRPTDLGGKRDAGGYVTFNIASYTKQELRELKRRLVSELDQVRSVASWIESREFQPSVRSDALIARSGPDNNHLYPPGDIRNRSAATEPAAAPELKKLHTAMMKKCSQILAKLMKQKNAFWFNTPVDVAGMGLHDYHQIIKNPMDLGTVRSKLRKGFYLAPLDFAADIRLTFNNALIYNPQGHDVHNLAGFLLRQFEGSFVPAYDRYEKQRSAIVRMEEQQRQRSLAYARSVPAPEPVLPISPPPVQTPKPAPPPPRLQQQQAPQQPSMRASKPPPKPKVHDPDKRAMTMEEKEKLGAALQNLPEDRMAVALQIISKRNETQQNGDEVEIDFEMMDIETLWELDRYVANWNKMLSKMRKQRQEAMAGGHNPEDPSVVPTHPVSVPPCDDGNKSPVVVGGTSEAPAASRSKKGDPVEEDVDIGDEMPVTHYPPVEITKESSSGSSGSDSSSSSGSDSDSSSGSDSDDDGARSPATGSRRSPRS